ncbi:MAG: Nramp family divalent metal transporter [Pirellulales bacterium]
MTEIPPPVKRPPARLIGQLMAIGPGIVVTGSVIGSGELINTPVQAARFGFVLLWVVIISCVIKYFLQVEIGRHALVHNRTPFEALNALPGPKLWGTSWIGPVFVLGSVLTAASLVGILRATAGLLHAVVPIGANDASSVNAWCLVVFLVSFVVLWRGSYHHIERLITLLVGVFSLSVIVGLVLIQGSEYHIGAEQILSGLTFSLGENDVKLAAVAVVSLLGALGATGNELFMYPYWILEKGYGQYVGSPDDDGWLDRVRGWVRVLQVDVFVCTALATLTTLGYFLIGAAVFYGSGDEIAGDDIIDRLSAMYTNTYGAWSRSLFLVGAFCTLFSTLIVGTAAFARMWCDMIISFGVVPRDSQVGKRRLLRAVQAIYLVAFLAIALFYGKNPEELIIFGQYVSGLFGTPLLMFAIVWMAFRTDQRVRMGKVSATLLVLSVVVIAGCVVASEIQRMGGG